MSIEIVRRQRIRTRLSSLSMTAAELATAIGKSEGYISRIINHKVTPSDEVAKKIVKALKSTRAYLNL